MGCLAPSQVYFSSPSHRPPGRPPKRPERDTVSVNVDDHEEKLQHLAGARRSLFELKTFMLSRREGKNARQCQYSACPISLATSDPGWLTTQQQILGSQLWHPHNCVCFSLASAGSKSPTATLGDLMLTLDLSRTRPIKRGELPPKVL